MLIFLIITKKDINQYKYKYMRNQISNYFWIRIVAEIIKIVFSYSQYYSHSFFIHLFCTLLSFFIYMWKLFLFIYLFILFYYEVIYSLLNHRNEPSLTILVIHTKEIFLFSLCRFFFTLWSYLLLFFYFILSLSGNAMKEEKYYNSIFC